MTTTTTAPVMLDPATGRPATLRPYQAEAVHAPRLTWNDPRQCEHRLAIVLPTGGGKTVILAHVVRDELRLVPDAKIVILVHRDELIKQTVKKIKQWNPGVRVGVVKAAKNDVTAQVVVASVQTLGRSAARRRALGKVSLIIVDECHHSVADGYMSVLRDLGAYASAAPTRTLGVTATLERADRLGLGDVWQRVVFERDMDWMINNGYLVPPKIKQIRLDMDLEGLTGHGGDYSARALAAALREAHAPEALALAYQRDARRADGSLMQGVVFMPTVQLAVDTAQAFRALGMRAEVITGETPSGERDEIYARCERGEVDALINAMVLTEGFDMPNLECVVIGRPTKSRSLYIQMVGRGARLHTFPSGRRKTSFLVLDVAGASQDNDLRSVPQTRPTESGVRERIAEQTAAARQRAQERAEASKVTVAYRIHQRRGFGRKGVVVERIETRGGQKTVVTVAKIYNHPMPRLLDLGRQAVEADQERRKAELREAIALRRRVANS